jgi:hypothetical protein
LNTQKPPTSRCQVSVCQTNRQLEWVKQKKAEQSTAKSNLQILIREACNRK